MTVEQQLPAAGTERRQLSASQTFMCSFDSGDDVGAFGPRNIVTAGWRLQGRLDLAALQGALDDVAARHEGLRTLIVRDEDEPYGRVHPPSPVQLTASYLPAAGDRDRVAHEFLNGVEAGRCDIREMPLLRASLGRFTHDDAVLVLVTHHSVSDAWSMHVILRDVAVCYARRRGLPAPELPEMRQYGEHASWQQTMLAGEAASAARDYWQAKLAGGAFVTLPTDRTKQPEVTPVYSVHRFLFDQELFGATSALARSMRSSPFMVLFAGYNLFLHRRTGATDIVAPTFTTGRSEPEFHETVGLFFNLVPVRTDLAGCTSFRDVVDRTRATLLEALTYELPFREVLTRTEPALMAPFLDLDGVVNTFEVNHYPRTLAGDLIGDVRYTGLRRRLISATDTSEIPNGTLWDFDLDPAGDMVGLVKYNSLEFDESSIVALVEDYRELLRTSVATPDSPLAR